MLILNITQGQDFTILGNLTTTSGSPPITSAVNLTGCNLKMQVKTEAGVLLATCYTVTDDGSLTITNEVGGLFTVLLAHTVTVNFPEETLNWDLWLISSGGTIYTPVGRGQIYVIQAITTL